MKAWIIAYTTTFVIGLALILTACTTAQVQKAGVVAGKVNAQLQAACALAMPLAQMAAPLPTAGPFIAAGVTVGCGTAEGLARLAADPSSAAWVNQQVGLLRAALAKPA